jgi:hypothetical protein
MQSLRLTAACSHSSEGRSCQLRSPSMKQPPASACPRLDPSPRDPGSAQHPVTSGNSTHRNRCVLLWGCPPVRPVVSSGTGPGGADLTTQPGNQPPGRPGTPITGLHRHQGPAGVLAPAGQHHREGPRSRHRDPWLATRPGPALPARATRWLASPLRLPCLRRRTSGYARRRLRGECSQRSAGSEGVHRGPAGPRVLPGLAIRPRQGANRAARRHDRRGVLRHRQVPLDPTPAPAQASRLLAALADPKRGFEAVVVGSRCGRSTATSSATRSRCSSTTGAAVGA